MITVNNKQFRNLEEQVQKNKEDIERYHQVDQVLADWGIRVLGVVPNVGDLPTSGNSYGDAYGVGQPGESNAPWPGERMTTVDSTGSNNYDKVWTATFSKKFQYCIFNDGYKNAGFPASMAEWSPLLSEYSFSSGGGWTALVSTTYQDPGPDLYRVYTYKNNWAEKYVYAWADSEDVVYYVWTRANPSIGQDEDYWLNVGALSLVGPQGPQGPVGPAGPQGVRGSKWTSHSNFPTASQPGEAGDQWLATSTGDIYQRGTSTWTLTGNIRGPQGVQGPQGPAGRDGAAGPQGPQGPKGDTGQSFKIAGFVASTDLLPTPTESIRSQAYAVGNQTDGYDMYVIVPNNGDLQWLNMGRISGVEGPQGPVGPQGPAGTGVEIVYITGTPETATEGTLSQEDVATLTASPMNYIQFFNENFYPQDVEIEKGYIVYSHVGTIDNITKIKTLVLTIATGGWVLTATTLGDEGDSAQGAMYFNVKIGGSALKDATDKANWDKLWSDINSNGVSYPVFVDGKQMLGFYRYNDTDMIMTYISEFGKYTQKTENTSGTADYPYIRFASCLLSKAHSSYLYKILGANIAGGYSSPYLYRPWIQGEYLANQEVMDFTTGETRVVNEAYLNFYTTSDTADATIGIYDSNAYYDRTDTPAKAKKGYIHSISIPTKGIGTTYFKVITPEEVDEKIAAAGIGGGGGSGENNLDFVADLPSDTTAQTGDLIYVRTTDNTLWRFEYDDDVPQGQWIDIYNYNLHPGPTTLCFDGEGQTCQAYLASLLESAFSFYEEDSGWYDIESSIDGVPYTGRQLDKEVGPLVDYVQAYKNKYRTLLRDDTESSIKAPNTDPHYLFNISLSKNREIYDETTGQYVLGDAAYLRVYYYIGYWTTFDLCEMRKPIGGSWQFSSYNDLSFNLGTTWNFDNIYFHINVQGTSEDTEIKPASLWYNANWHQLDEPEVPERANFPQIFAPIIRQSRESQAGTETYIQARTINAELGNYNHAIVLNGGEFANSGTLDQSSFFEYGKIFNLWGGDHTEFPSYKPQSDLTNRKDQFKALLDIPVSIYSPGGHRRDEYAAFNGLVLSINDYGLVHHRKAYLYPTNNGTLAVESYMPTLDQDWYNPTSMGRMIDINSEQGRRVIVSKGTNHTELYYGYIADTGITKIVLDSTMPIVVSNYTQFDVRSIQKVSTTQYSITGIGWTSAGQPELTTLTINNSDNLIKISPIL